MSFLFLASCEEQQKDFSKHEILIKYRQNPCF